MRSRPIEMSKEGRTSDTGALIQPTEAKGGRPQACKKGHFFGSAASTAAARLGLAESTTYYWLKRARRQRPRRRAPAGPRRWSLLRAVLAVAVERSAADVRQRLGARRQRGRLLMEAIRCLKAA
jgi:hypothetical protein